MATRRVVRVVKRPGAREWRVERRKLAPFLLLVGRAPFEWEYEGCFSCEGDAHVFAHELANPVVRAVYRFGDPAPAKVPAQ